VYGANVLPVGRFARKHDDGHACMYQNKPKAISACIHHIWSYREHLLLPGTAA
jgi:hypothetical protein